MRSLVEPPKECNVVECKWVFQVKYDGKGEAKADLSLRVFLKNMASILKKYSLLLLIYHQFIPY